MHWTIDAACVEYPTEIFFNDNQGWTAENKMAIKLACNNCAVKLECLESALAEEQDTHSMRFGIRGGMGARERERLWSALLARRAGWCSNGRHIVEIDDEGCVRCSLESQKLA